MSEVIVSASSMVTKRLGVGSSAYAAFVQSPVGTSPMYGDSTTFFSLDGSPSGGGTGDGRYPDKLGNLEKMNFHQRLQVIRFFYEMDPLASTAVDKTVEIGIGPLLFDRNECTDKELDLYKSVLPLLREYLQKAAVEYLLSGLVIPQVSWKSITSSDLDLRGRSTFEMPDKIWILNPDSIVLKFSGFNGQVDAYMTVDDELAYFIQHNGTKKDGTKDVESYQRMVEEFPEFVAAVKRGEKEVLLENATIIRRKPKTYDPYPSPYLLPAIESLEFKRNLKKMDYSIASRVISAIMLIKLGNDLFPLTEDDEDQLTALKTELLWRNKPNNIERVFQLFGNHTLTIEWIYPDTAAMLNQEKYAAINEDIFYALGLPRIIVSGETLRSASSSAEYAMFSPAESMRRMREDLIIWANQLLKDVKKRNNLKNVINVKFDELRLYDIEKLSNVAAKLFASNAISLTSLAQSAGYDFAAEVEQKAIERDLMKEFDIPEFPAMPFSPSPKTVGAPTTKPTVEKPAVAKPETPKPKEP